MKDDNELPIDSKIPNVIVVDLGNNGFDCAQFTAGLFAFCGHGYFRYEKPSAEARIMALRFVADTIESNVAKQLKERT